MVKGRGLKLNLPGGRWRQSLGEAGPHQVFHKKSFVKKIPIFSNLFIFIIYILLSRRVRITLIYFVRERDLILTL